jgi:hypothetical protein
MLEVVTLARVLGSRTLNDGTELIGRAPHVAPEAWLHILFGGLTPVQVDRVQELIRRPLPGEYAQFLLRFNGLSLFSGALSIDGLRWNYARTGDAAWQPFSVEDPNVLERPRGADPTSVFVGGHAADGSLLYMTPPDPRVYRCSRTSPTVLNSWPGLQEMLSAEAARLAALFDAQGRKINANVRTAPIPQP